MANSMIDRFEQKVIRAESGCHLWTAAKNNGGYGHISFNGKVVDAHRVSYELYVAEIPAKMFVLHKCDNPSCVNPEHLFLGTQHDNLSDMTRKSRRSCGRGEKHGSAKLTAEQVRAIRVDNRIHRVIAEEYGVGKTTIGSVKSGIYWRTV